MYPSSAPSRSCSGLFAALVASLFLGGCQSTLQNSNSLLGVITPYRVEVVQGNVVTQEQIALVKPGLSRAQVRDVLGSPLLTDIFHENRWDYVFTIRRQGAEPQQRQVVLRFEGDSLASIEAPELPSEREFVTSIDTFRKVRNPRPLALTPEQIQALPEPARVASPSADPAATPPARTYPPLEPR